MKKLNNCLLTPSVAINARGVMVEKDRQIALRVLRVDRQMDR